MIQAGDAFLIHTLTGDGFGAVLSVNHQSGCGYVLMQSGRRGQMALQALEVCARQLHAWAEEVPLA